MLVPLPYICLLYLFLLYHHVFAFSATNEVSFYSQQCSSIVPESSTTVRNRQNTLPDLHTPYYTGGENLFKRKQLNQSYYYYQHNLRFHVINSKATIANGVSKVEGVLYIRSPYRYYDVDVINSTYVGSYYDRRRNRRRSDRIRFSLNGFWSEISRKLCMVGTASWLDEQGEPINLDAVFKLSYENESPNIRTGAISGILESVSSKNDTGYFDPISIFSFMYNSNYQYSVVSEEIEASHINGGDAKSSSKDQSLTLQPSEFCSLMGWRNFNLDMEFALDCNKTRLCSPVNPFLPSSLSLNPFQCAEYEAKVRYLLKFQNTSYYYNDQTFNVDSSLIGEASWDETNNELVVVACRILNPFDHFSNTIGDCDIRLRLRFPSVRTITKNDEVVGQLWTNKSSNDPGYFEKINVASHQDNGVVLPGVMYEYTELNRVKKLCPKKNPAKKVKIYPDPRSYNMRFDMSVKNSQDERIAWGFVTPISVGNELYERNAVALEAFGPTSDVLVPQIAEIVKTTTTNKLSLVNISYIISIEPFYNFKDWVPTFNSSMGQNGRFEITAEGVYDDQTGHLCALGCRKIMKSNTNKQITHDCEILVNFEYASLNEISGGFIKGTIQTTRANSDPLYFKDLIISSTSFYTQASERSIWRMDLEIALVLISNTLSCVFIALQIFHIRRNPEVKTSISILMLMILTSAQMIPLVLNFEAMFLSSRDKQTFLLSTGGWLEVNEVTVRIITMIAFLLQIRLFQHVWNSKTSEEPKKESWAGEKKAAIVALPMYVLGGLLTLLLNWIRNNYFGNKGMIYKKYPLWGDLRSYAGLILDGFLLPQILLNIIGSSKGKALSYPFYVGTSAIRVVPHAYDQYRMRNYPMAFTNQTYYYANPSVDFYSTAWDVVIPCGIVALAVIVFLQQRRAGRWVLLPQRLREFAMYENVPSVDS